MTASLSAYLESNNIREEIATMRDDSNKSHPRHRDARPTQPRRLRSKRDLVNSRDVNSESALTEDKPPLAPRTFSRLHSDNFLYSSDLAHVRENAKQRPRPVMRKESFRSTSSAEDNDDISIDDSITDVERPKLPARRPSIGCQQVLPTRPSYQDRWNAAFATKSSPRGRSLSRRQGPPRSARRLASVSCDATSRGEQKTTPEDSIATATTSSLTNGSVHSIVSACRGVMPTLEPSLEVDEETTESSTEGDDDLQNASVGSLDEDVTKIFEGKAEVDAPSADICWSPPEISWRPPTWAANSGRPSNNKKEEEEEEDEISRRPSVTAITSSVSPLMREGNSPLQTRRTFKRHSTKERQSRRRQSRRGGGRRRSLPTVILPDTIHRVEFIEDHYDEAYELEEEEDADDDKSVSLARVGHCREFPARNQSDSDGKIGSSTREWMLPPVALQLPEITIPQLPQITMPPVLPQITMPSEILDDVTARLALVLQRPGGGTTSSSWCAHGTGSFRGQRTFQPLC